MVIMGERIVAIDRPVVQLGGGARPQAALGRLSETASISGVGEPP